MSQHSREDVLEPFPHIHIQNIAGGTVGSVWLFRNQEGEIIRAEARLLQAHYDYMVIVSPRILSIFQDRKIKLDALGVWPMFYLEPIKEGSCLAATLEEIEPKRFSTGLFKRAGASSALSGFRRGLGNGSKNNQVPRGKHPVEAACRDGLGLTSRNLVATHPPKAIFTSSGSIVKKLQDHIGSFDSSKSVPLIIVTPASRQQTSTASSASTIKFPTPPQQPLPASADSSHPDVLQTGAPYTIMAEIKAEIEAILPAVIQSRYNYFITVEREKCSRNPKKRGILRINLRKLVKEYGIKDLHNEYARLLNGVEKRTPYQLPEFK